MNDEIPLFPLNTVLFPDGVLSLRIFETRYVDMIRECARNDANFGVCLIVDNTIDDPVQPARIGTQASIADFFTAEDGLLGIRAIGRSRFRVIQTSVRNNGLIVAAVDPLPEEIDCPLDDRFFVLRQILERIFEQLPSSLLNNVTKQQFDSARWVGHRLAELLPLETKEKQILLELDDPERRLQHLLYALARLQD